MFKVVLNDNGKIPEDNIAYVVGKNGIYLKKKFGIVDALVKVGKISFLQDVETYARLTIPKIPKEMFGQIVSFFKTIYKKHSSEAAALIYFSESKKKFKTMIPYQKVSSGKADYLRNKTFKDFTFLATVHSHGAMGAFHSPLDKKDEKFLDGLHITVGDIDKESLDIASSVVVNGERFPCLINEYVENVEPVVMPSNLYVWNVESRKSEPKLEIRWKLKEFPFDESWLRKVIEDKVEVEVITSQLSPYFQHFPYNDIPDRLSLPVRKEESYDPCSDCPFNAHKMDKKDSPRFSSYWWESGE